MKRSILAVLAVVLCLAAVGSAARADVAPEEDNPEGCTTAASESETGCGAQGRDHWGNAGHQPPIEACKETVAASGSVVTRILSDGPRHDDGTLAFTPGVCVYLPPGYDTSGLRYPVVYLLHGGGGDQSDWVTFGSARATLDAAADSGHPVIAVMPDGRSGQYFDYLDGSFLIETYLLRYLVSDIDARYRTIADRSGRAIAGLSNGGYGALHLAAKAPHLFSVAGAMSGNLGARTMTGLGDSGAAYYQGNVPYQLASNLDAVDLIIDWGATCTSDVTVDLCATWAFEQAFRGDNTAFRARLDEVGYKGEVDYRETEGSHAWRWWTKWLAERDLPFFLERLTPATSAPTMASAIPESFRYGSVFDEFEAWGYEVRVERDVREFLDLTEVRLDRMTVQGSGSAALTTAGRYTPGRQYTVAGASDGSLDVVADALGRLAFPVDLGPSHAHDQFTPQSDLAEATGGHWLQRNVQISPQEESDPLADTWPTYDGPPPGASVLAVPVFAPDASASAPPLADDADVAAPTTEEVAPISTTFAEPVRKVSIPLTALFLSSIGGGVALWWRRRNAGVESP